MARRAVQSTDRSAWGTLAAADRGCQTEGPCRSDDRRLGDGARAPKVRGHAFAGRCRSRASRREREALYTRPVGGTMHTDRQLEDDVRDELDWDPRISDAGQIAVAAHLGHVTLR